MFDKLKDVKEFLQNIPKDMPDDTRLNITNAEGEEFYIHEFQVSAYLITFSVWKVTDIKLEKAKKEKDTYQVYVPCRNCDNQVIVTIPKGTTIEEYCKEQKMICHACGCLMRGIE